MPEEHVKHHHTKDYKELTYKKLARAAKNCSITPVAIQANFDLSPSPPRVLGNLSGGGTRQGCRVPLFCFLKISEPTK
jgi:hypothetical protein